ncbi:hypothetical protein ASF45_03990 [Pseudorhodoferax sp. Leaf265]|nr:efflux RND transporter permease subunit [Pseudorhodoferax sp. Leaf265]KQP21347.1 hypothetical protein ASF45_03990 [Pseudorhodoferax sp. Leaf265]
MAFFSGSTSVIYRQFSITIVTSMVLSVVVALTLTPALCADAEHACLAEPPRRRGLRLQPAEGPRQTTDACSPWRSTTACACSRWTSAWPRRLPGAARAAGSGLKPPKRAQA